MPGIIASEVTNGHVHVNGGREETKAVLPLGHSKTSFPIDRVISKNNGHGPNNVGPFADPEICVLPAPKRGPSDGVRGEVTDISSVSSSFQFNHHDETEVSITRIIDEIHETVHTCKKQFSLHKNNPFAHTVTLEGLTDFINGQRLRDMPEKGSTLDKVLRWALVFAKRIDEFSVTIEPYFRSSPSMARDIWSCCRSLLQLSTDEPHVLLMLKNTFEQFYRIGESLDNFREHKAIFGASKKMQRLLATMFSNIVTLALETTTFYRKRVSISHECIHEHSVRFGDVLTSFDFHKTRFQSEIWTYCLETSEEIRSHDVSLESIRIWLLTGQKEITITSESEGTCLWFDKHLMDFEEADDEIFAIYGRPGIGKSVLAKWITSRLMTHQKGITLFYSMDGHSKASTTSLSLVRSLVSQLLERRIGDVQLYKRLQETYEGANANGDTTALERRLWKIFEETAKLTWQLTIIIDGLDHIKGGFQAANAVVSRISKIAKENGENTLKAIILCKQFQERFDSSVKIYQVSDEDVEDDIEIYVSNAIKSWSNFGHLTYESRRKIIKTVVSQSKSNFSWASLTLQLIRRERTVEGILAVLGTPCKDLDQLTERVLISLDWKDHDTRRILSWLLFAKQDLTVAALKELLSLDFKKVSRNTRFTSFQEDLEKACGSIVVIDNNVVRFINPAIMERLLRIVTEGKYITIKDCQKEIVFGCWAYVSLCELDSDLSYLSEDVPSASSLQILYKKHHLLEYCAKHWVKHYHHFAGTKIIVDEHCKALFPRSGFFCQIERAVWTGRRVEEKHIHKYFNMSVEIREKLFGQSHICVVQGVLNLGYFFEHFFVGKNKHVDHYHRAWVLARNCFKDRKDKSFVMICATKYIEIVERHEHNHRDEEAYKWAYTYCKDVCGVAHDDTIKYAIILGKLYIRKEKKELACSIYREAWEHCQVHRSSSDELFISLSDHFVEILEITEKYKEIISVRKKCIVDVTRTTKVWDLTRVRHQIKLAIAYGYEGEYEETEQTLIQVILGITESFKSCEHHEHVHIHIARIEATLAMSEFFRSQGRYHECENLLVELWKETITIVETLETHNESFMEIIVSLAKEMELLEMHGVAIEVYTTCRKYFKKSTTLITTDIARVISLRLAVLCEHHHDVVIQEEVLKETFEITIKTKKTETIIETTVSLVSFYEQHENWTEVITTCSKALTLVWGTVLKGGTKTVYVPKHCHHEAIELAWRLAIAHEKCREIKKAEEIYLTIFHACRRSLTITETVTFDAIRKTIYFYEVHGHQEKAIKVYVDFFNSCHSEFGITHFRTLEICYELAKLHIRLGNEKEAEKIYLKIWQGCLVKSQHCIQDSFEAGRLLCELYERQHRHSEATKIYKILWYSVCDTNVAVTIEDTAILTLYRKFKHILTIESNFELLYDVTTIFESYCMKVHGESHTLTIEALLELATIIERTETRRSEAITIYERILKISTEITITEEIKKTLIVTKKHLAKCYSHSSTTVVKAEETYVEIWNTCKHTHGVSHSSTLQILEELMVFHKTHKSTKKAVEILETTIIEIFNTETDSERLFHCGLSLAACYRKLGMVEEGTKFCKDLHRFLFTYKAGKATKDVRFTKWTVRQVGKTVVDRKYQIFLFAFEEHLHNKDASHKESLYSFILSNLLIETELYQSWDKVYTIEVSCEQKLLHGCRLISHLQLCHRAEEAVHIKEQLWIVFKTKHTHKGTEITETILRELFEKCVVTTAKTDCEIVVVDIAIKLVEEYVKKHEFKSVSVLSVWTHTHIKITQSTTSSLKLVNILSSSIVVRYCKDETILKKITETTDTIIIESVTETTTTTVSWHERSIVEVNKVIVLLGKQKNYSRMLAILESLWEHRAIQTSWTPGVVSLIGRRLVETYFVLGETNKALKLCERICYNYERVWGLMNPITLESYDFLSELFVAAKKYEKAISVHERILQQAMGWSKALPDGININEILLRQTDLFKAAINRSYVGKEVAIEVKQHRESFFHKVKTFFTDDDDCKKKIEVLQTKTHKDDFGCWKEPAKWVIMDEEEGEDKNEAHHKSSNGTNGITNGKSGGYHNLRNGGSRRHLDVTRGTSHYGRDRKSVLFSNRSFENLFKA